MNEGRRAMIDRTVPVTEDELHAYVDGELPADRRTAVEAWLATHPDDAARVADWRAQAVTIRAHYHDLVEEAVPERLQLQRLMRGGRPWRAVAAAALIAALVGGVAGWMAHGASAEVTTTEPNLFDIYTREAVDAHKLYVGEVTHPVEVPAAEREHLVHWLSKRIGHELRPPDLEPTGLSLIGGRLLPGASGASAFLMYESPSGERFTLYCAAADAPQTGMRYREADRYGSFYWVDRGLAYVLSGPADRKRLWAITKSAYDQIDKVAPAKTDG
jgi:anti-sigma factor RsiW